MADGSAVLYRGNDQVTADAQFRIGLHRAEYPAGYSRPAALGPAEVAGVLGDFVWSSLVDPGDAVVRPSGACEQRICSRCTLAALC